MKRARPLLDRLFERIEEDWAGCWIWTGPLRPSGYGQITHRNRCPSTHRAMYECLVGPIPQGLELDHLCRDRRCCRPSHLEPVSRAENVARGLRARGYADNRTHCAHGHPWPENAYRLPSGARKCRACKREAWQQTAEEQKRRRRVGYFNSRKTHCLRGHPFDKLNTRYYRGRRHCRECERIRGAAKSARRMKGLAA